MILSRPLGITQPLRGSWVCTYLAEGVLDDHLSISVRYARKQVPYSGVGLLVNVRLPFWDRFGLSRLGAGGRRNLFVPKRDACLFHDGLPDVVADPVQVKAESLGKLTLG